MNAYRYATCRLCGEDLRYGEDPPYIGWSWGDGMGSAYCQSTSIRHMPQRNLTALLVWAEDRLRRP